MITTLDRLRGRLASRTRLRELPQLAPYETLQALTPIAGTRSGSPLLFYTADAVVGRDLYETGGFDEEEIAWSLAYLGHPQHHGTVIEVGANIGSTTVSLFHRHGAQRVVAFEPEIRNFRLLRCNVSLNGLEDLVVTRRAAISDKNGRLDLEVSPDNLGDHRVRVQTSDGVFNEQDRATTTVEALKLDDATADIIDPSLVWVDTQGHEGQVLAGSARLLARRIPWIVEYWPYALRRASGFETFHSVIAENFTTAVDVRQSIQQGSAVVFPAGDLSRVAEGLPGGRDESHLDNFTDLILLP